MELLPFIVAGLTTGAVYGLAGVGLVLTFKTSGVFNFAHGALATVAAYGFYTLHVQLGLPWPAAAAIIVLVVGPLLGTLMELLARRVQGSSLALQIAATVGVLLAIEAAARLIYGTDTLRTVPSFLGSGGFQLAGLRVQWSSVVTFVLALVATAALSLYFRFARRGIAMRAVVDDPDLLNTAGTSPVATRRAAWIIGGVFICACGVLFAPLMALDPENLTLLVVAAFGAAAVGAFTKLPLTFAGGLGIGVLASLCTKWFTSGLLAGVPPALSFIVLFVVILVYPKRFTTIASFTVPRIRAAWKAPAALQLCGGAVILIVLVLVPAFAGLHLTDWTAAVATVVVFLSLGLLVRTSGQVSLCHVSFMAIGAASFAHLSSNAGVPWLVSLLIAGLIAVPVGALLAIPAGRLSGLYLALATLGFGLLLQYMFYTQPYMFGTNMLGLDEARPQWSWIDVNSDSGFYYLTLVIVVVIAGVVIALGRGRLGRLLEAMADSPTALATSGASAEVTRVIVFCVASFLAAVGGALVAVAMTTVSSSAYSPILSLTYFALIMINPGRLPWNALLAGAGLILIPSYLPGGDVSIVLQLLFGLCAILIAVLPGSSTAPAALTGFLDATFGRVPLRRPFRKTVVRQPVSTPAREARPAVLSIEDLQVRYGGQVAVDGLAFRAPTGQITGLIGPNGAGKTTTFNACSGLVRPSRGRVLLDGKDISRRRPSARARLGLGRTFQKVQLLESLTVRDNVAIGYESSLAGGNPLSHLFARPGQNAVVRARTDEALRLCDLTDLAATPVRSLSTGQRRLVELARCVAGDFRILLLDEPSSGLDRSETARFGRILRELVSERGIGILLVEHDMSLVTEICEQVYVLDFGRPLFAGTAQEAMRAPEVRAAYLGSEAVEAVSSHIATPIETTVA
ncbi:branched-chain amino acid ABC transporter permease/ATP-binding protein [Nocardia alni]|uniref:branched-chain amino acid ABC transporter permease/ATP-binding protein n=1 Tax=Nocardia alni TaxID=2815723 RepID=UPI001C212081|nr:branched-chain amino acid ABC transporter permease/ATP-binding protein [Nocardia alni]